MELTEILIFQLASTLDISIQPSTISYELLTHCHTEGGISLEG